MTSTLIKFWPVMLPVKLVHLLIKFLKYNFNALIVVDYILQDRYEEREIEREREREIGHDLELANCC